MRGEEDADVDVDVDVEDETRRLELGLVGSTPALHHSYSTPRLLLLLLLLAASAPHRTAPLRPQRRRPSDAVHCVLVLDLKREEKRREEKRGIDYRPSPVTVMLRCAVSFSFRSNPSQVPTAAAGFQKSFERRSEKVVALRCVDVYVCVLSLYQSDSATATELIT